MKLNKNTKHDVKAGDILRFDNGDEYTVKTIIEGAYRNALSFTIRDNRDGRTIYAYPSSELYGAEIVPFIDEGANI